MLWAEILIINHENNYEYLLNPEDLFPQKKKKKNEI